MNHQLMQNQQHITDNCAAAKWILHKWVRCTETTRGYWIVKCSLCRKKSNEEVAYCPSCGAKMAL